MGRMGNSRQFFLALAIALLVGNSFSKNLELEERIETVATSIEYPIHEVKNALMCQHSMENLPEYLKESPAYSVVLLDKNFHFMTSNKSTPSVTYPAESEEGIHLLSEIPKSKSHDVTHVERLLNFCSRTTPHC